MIDFTKLQMTTNASSNKVWLEGTGVLAVPALGGSGNTFGQLAIPHGFGSDNLLFQVGGTIFGLDVVFPWLSNDGRETLYASVDASNLYITCISEDASGFGQVAFNVNFFYKLLIP